MCDVVAMFETILVPTDGSEGMAPVIEQASGLAEAHDAELHFVNAVHTVAYGNLPLDTSLKSVSSMLFEEAESAVERAERQATTDRFESAVVEGQPSRKILEYARENDCDLVVMGTHGRGGLDRLLLGSVAERVVRSSKIPVLTVRVGVDDSSSSDRTDIQPFSVDPSVTEVIE